MLDKFVPGIEKISDVDKYDPNTQTEYRETKWRVGNHEIDVNCDEYGYHARADQGPASTNMDEGGLVNWVLGLFGLR